MRMTISPLSRNKGFTLIEIMMVAFMLSLVMAAVYTLYGTSQKAASMEEEVVEVQQNLRIAMDIITRDIRHAGFLSSEKIDLGLMNKGGIASIAAPNPNTIQPVGMVMDNTASTAGIPPTPDAFGADRVHADFLTLNYASPFTTFAKISAEQTGVLNPFVVMTPESVDLFEVDDRVRVINTTRHEQSTNLSSVPTGSIGTLFKIAAVNRATPSLTLAEDTAVAGINPATTIFKRGDIIAKVSKYDLSTYPNTVTYCLGPAANCGPAVDCTRQGATDQTLCLVRMENSHPEVIASRFSGLQFSYLLDDGSEIWNPALLSDLGAIRAVRVTLTGRTATVSRQRGDLASGEKTRSLSSLIALKNRLIAR